MAKYSVSYDNGVKTETLVFRDKVFDITQIHCEWGTKGNKPCFDYQLFNMFDDLNYNELEDIAMNLNAEFEDDLFDALERLDELE